MTTICSKINQRSLNDFSPTFISFNRPGDGKHIQGDETRLFVVSIRRDLTMTNLATKNANELTNVLEIKNWIFR